MSASTTPHAGQTVDVPAASRPSPAPRPGADSVPLTPMQEQIWFHTQLNPEESVYNNPIGIRLQGPLHPSALETALNDIVCRHDALRLRFSAPGGRPSQEASPPESVSVSLPLTDLSDVPAAQRDAEVTRRLQAEVRRPLDLENGPLLRAALYRLDTEDHILVVTTHHLVMDGWSKHRFRQDLAELYAAAVNDAPSSLSPLSLQYTDYATWTDERHQNRESEREWAYWRENLEQSPILEFPTARPRPATHPHSAGHHTFRLPLSLTKEIESLSRTERVTLFMTLLATFEVLLSRYARQSDFVVGCPVAGRTRPDLEPLLGCFMNMVPLRADLTDTPSFRTLLKRVRRTTLEALSRSPVSLTTLIEELQPERNPSYPPLYQVLFQLRNMPGRETSERGGLHWTPVAVAPDRTLLDLQLELTRTDTGLDATLIYSTDLFDHAFIERMAGHYEQLLRSIVANPARSVAKLQLLTAPEIRQLLNEWNDTDRTLPSAAPVHELIAAQAARTPDAVALVFEDQRRTYRELNEQSNQLAHYLQRQGVGPETRVALCVDRSPEMVVGLLGILKAGGAYVPLDPTLPMDRLGFMLQDAQVSLVLTQRNLVAELPPPDAPVICLDDDWLAIAQEPLSAPDSGVTPHTLAYVIYTSGSTGRPKGVAIEHGSLTEFLWGVVHKPGMCADDVVLNASTLSFDISVLVIFTPLMVGAQLVLVPQEVVSDGFRLAEALRDYSVSFLNVTPAHWELLVNAGWTGAPLRTAVSGGEPLTPPLAEALLERSVTLWNLYGPTETTVFSTAAHIETAADISIGHPVANTTVYVLDENSNLVPIGVPGELYIGGNGLARGYLNRPELTAERFVPNPFTDDPGARLYRTGDLVRWRKDGALDFLGRTDHQVKLHGFRIELGEIETVLTDHPDIRQAVVVLNNTDGPERLVAYVVPTAELPSHAALRSFLRDTLPDYMVPATFVSLSALPLTPSGKVDRAALPDPAPEMAGPAETVEAARTPIEKMLTEIWTKVLGVQTVGRRDNFFEIGGHSLLAMQVMSRLRERTGAEASLALLFTNPTIEELAEVIPQPSE